MSQKVIIKKGELEGSIIEERMGKFKVTYKKPEKKIRYEKRKNKFVREQRTEKDLVRRLISPFLFIFTKN